MLKRLAMLFLGFAPFAFVQAQEDAPETEQPRLGWFTWSDWDALHRKVSDHITDRIDTFDRFFGDERIEDEGKGSQVKFGLGPELSRFDDWSFENRLRLRLELPQLQHRLQLVIDNDVETEEAFRRRSPTVLESTRESRPDAALRTDLLERGKFKVSADAGVKTGSDWQAFGKLRGRWIRDTDICELRLTQSVQYYSEDRFRGFSEAQIARAWGDGWLISQAARVDYRETAPGYTPGALFRVEKDHGSRSASRVELNGAWPQTDPKDPAERDWENYQARLTYRRLAHAPWLFLELAGGVRFSAEHDYAEDPFVGVIMEMVLGDLR
jgi:hypothetical protein